MSATGRPAPRRRGRGRYEPAPVRDPVVPPGPSRVDLHAHSTRSDGVLEPAALLAAVAAAGVRTFALTDHDTIAGYRELTASDAVPDGLELIAGIEINAVVENAIGLWEGELHILGFGMDAADEPFEAVLQGQRARRRLRFGRTAERLRELGLPIDAQLEAMDLRADDALGRPTIARALVAAGFATSVEDAFARLIGRDRPAYVPRAGLDPTEAIAAIRAAGGIPSLAHFPDAAGRRPLVRELAESGLAALEVHYRAFDRPTTEAVAAVARELGLLATGGTDYHGDTGSYAESHAALWVPEAVGDAIRRAVDGRLTG